MADKLITLPSRGYMLKLLLGVDGDKNLQDFFYPNLIDKLAGWKKFGSGVGIAVYFAYQHYNDEKPATAMALTGIRAMNFINVLVSDNEILGQAKDTFAKNLADDPDISDEEKEAFLKANKGL